ncbi:MAG: hypothetical protein Q4C36_03245 [Coriobacteriia bacterium]|nr:hypothetical protein [Coriobacteriia bacterium]
MKAKLIIATMLAAVLAMGLVACGQQGGSGSGSTPAQTSSEFATLGDVLAAETESMTSTFDEKRYVCVFSVDGTWWRVEADLEEGFSDKLNEVWTEDQAKVEELLSPIAVTKAETLEAPSDEEVSALVGKTGAELKADGYEYSAGTLVVNGNETDCVAVKGSFDYLITFDGKVADENTDDPAGAVAELKVNAAAIQGVSWIALEGE